MRAIQHKSVDRSASRGFTLVELLVTITIITILAGMMLGALLVSRQAARTSKTKATIAKLHEALIPIYQAYRTRRVPIDIDRTIVTPVSSTPPGQQRPAPPRVGAWFRLRAIRELMRMEMPERLTDVYFPKTDPDPTIPPVATDESLPIWMAVPYKEPSRPPGWYWQRMSRSSIARRIFRRFVTSPPGNQDHVSAELLYLIVTYHNPEAREDFMDNEIGDVDGDGYPEFVDAWKRPIAFLRWAPGFSNSDRQLDYPVSHQQADSDHDPFDPYNLDIAANPANDAPRGWRLTPLIYSAGPDGVYDINPEPTYLFGFSPVPPSPPPPPYHFSPCVLLNGNPNLAGASTGDGSFDNIHNHRIEAEL
jgi:prepilin-type N-terminal cleavage/methylation domain-containing protein